MRFNDSQLLYKAPRQKLSQFIDPPQPLVQVSTLSFPPNITEVPAKSKENRVQSLQEPSRDRPLEPLNFRRKLAKQQQRPERYDRGLLQGLLGLVNRREVYRALQGTTGSESYILLTLCRNLRRPRILFNKSSEKPI